MRRRSESRRDDEPFGIPWYTPETYPRMLAVMEDADLLPADFEHWREAAEHQLARARERGLEPVKAHMDPDSFATWCREHGLRANVVARMEYASEIAARERQRSRHAVGDDAAPPEVAVLQPRA